ncbi:MAG: pyridoxamine 5'-phosphate oxidase family protein, partial [Desulforhabdus sp.]|nr:pyridoxamine 5'-phosphate oxidase family protein [Desulforhabdus sp.]
MRRKDKQIDDPTELEAVIRNAIVCRIGFSGNDVPYIVPVNFGYRENRLYFHSAPEGRKIDILRQNNQVCFEMETDVEVVRADSPCNWSTKYRSVIGHGKATFVEDI